MKESQKAYLSHHLSKPFYAESLKATSIPIQTRCWDYGSRDISTNKVGFSLEDDLRRKASAEAAATREAQLSQAFQNRALPA
jgi:hypothetical protein